MSKYIDAERLMAEIDSRMEDCKLLNGRFSSTTNIVRYDELLRLRNLIESLHQEQTEVDLKKLKNKAELIANEIMMGVQGNKYHTCIYDTASNDFNHAHLFRAALKGIEIGLNARKL